MATAGQDIRPTPPYIPYRTLINSLDVFDAHGLPPQIDRGIWKTQPGGVQGLIFAAYKFLGLIDDAGKPSERLAALVKDKEHRPQQIEKLLRAAFPEILNAHDLAKMTPKMLEDEFERAYAVLGDTKRKAITFFLQAAKGAQIPLSGFLESQVRVARKTRRAAATSKKDSNTERESETSFEGNGDSEVVPITLAPGRIVRIELPEDWNPEKDLGRLLKLLRLSLSTEEVELE